MSLIYLKTLYSITCHYVNIFRRKCFLIIITRLLQLYYNLYGKLCRKSNLVICQDKKTNKNKRND